MKNVYEQVEENIDNLVANQADWTASATNEELDLARAGRPILYFYDKEVPAEWLNDIKGKRVLCLAGAGGLQAPILACAGAKVTVIDISNKMLEKDREIAEREKLDIEIVKGNMCDLSMFADELFDLIVNPPSLMYIPDLSLVYKECYRVLKNGGQFIIMAPNPVNYLCDWVNDENGGYYKAIHKMPWCSKDYDDSEWIEYGHSMEEYLGGLIRCGFVLDGYMECQREDITELMFMVRAKKL
ncbi:class I SAM-dependent methyltransferase [Butyrivibrio proteoclasticus]|uniref:class I SAM-dependent methyltransferase n=1 Tax=Butyrivibrio proteoclasticus TaxID=43305 RepID=UPI000683F2AE|nr:class I SAM-dependent methyltransferase [Butyrivibrio proteoclasticus]